MAIDADRLAVVSLDAERAGDARLTGGKAAQLARAAAAGLPVLPGFVVVPATHAPDAPHGEEELRRAWAALAGDGTRPLIVRSSSAHEDTTHSSMAGQFATVADVRGWDDFTAAVRVVLDSAHRVDAVAGGADDMAVLIQPMARPVAGGVMFGADPVEGRDDRILISAVPGSPARLVDGRTEGVRYQLTRYGRRLHTRPAEPRRRHVLGTRRLLRLVALARRTRRLFGAPQDMEFGFDDDDRLWLFQSRPITAMAARPARGARLLGPGPVAETLPEVLQPLEEDLWVAPMAHGLAVALDLTGAAPRRRLRAVPLVRTVDGRAVADLRLLGAVPSPHRVLDVLNPAPGARAAGAAWRVGRLRSALPLLALDLMADVDRRLAEYPAPGEMLGGRLVSAASWGRRALSALHAQEALAGALLGGGSGITVAGEALAVLSEGRAAGGSDADLMAGRPVLLALVPPSLHRSHGLPARTGWTGVPRGVGTLPVREGLRLRIRWVQEMQVGMVREFAVRLAAAHLLDDPADVALLRWSELVAAADGVDLPADLSVRVPRPERPPLPAEFRLVAGRPVAEPNRPGGGAGGQGAGGGTGTGTVWDGEGPRPARAVLVVRVLDPALAALLPGLAGLVSETGSPLSHLAVLAREHRVPTAVGVGGAVDRFVPGTALTVDGATGLVTGLAEAAGDRARGGTGGNGAGPGKGAVA
ncbi:PEP/pyruvate-binding domain-containing protein [Embleya sp. NBC_00896]|uniref:PEP/pyruvate-binding domain-containing protein n=1 Tax=Embleya sp. NBC_00896 TaxID=2975961 RepID=UPI002F91306D|nr:PEP-utilizing enzyme [Embleya sp. NBC_00896]